MNKTVKNLAAAISSAVLAIAAVMAVVALGPSVKASAATNSGWYIIGNAAELGNWQLTDAPAMTPSGTDKATFSFTTTEGETYNFKVIPQNTSWDGEVSDNGNNFTFTAKESSYTTITLDVSAGKVTWDNLDKNGGQTLKQEYFVMGDILDDWKTATKMTAAGDGTYKAVFENLASDWYHFKVVQDWDTYGWDSTGQWPSQNAWSEKEENADHETLTVIFNPLTGDVTSQVAPYEEPATPDDNPASKPEDETTAPDGNPASKPGDETTAPDDNPASKPEDETTAPDGNPASKPEDETTAPDGNPASKPEDETQAPVKNDKIIFHLIEKNIPDGYDSLAVNTWCGLSAEGTLVPFTEMDCELLKTWQNGGAVIAKDKDSKGNYAVEVKYDPSDPDVRYIGIQLIRFDSKDVSTAKCNDAAPDLLAALEAGGDIDVTVDYEAETVTFAVADSYEEETGASVEKPEINGENIKIETPDDELKAAISGQLTAEQLENLTEIKLDVDNIDESIGESDKALIDEAVKAASDGSHSYKVLNYFNIRLLAAINGEDVVITETDGEIEIFIKIDNPGSGTYKVVRVHGENAEVLDTYMKDGGITVKTDKFSTYAVIYSDVGTGARVPAALIVMLVLAGVAAAGAGTVIVNSKKNAE